MGRFVRIVLSLGLACSLTGVASRAEASAAGGDAPAAFAPPANTQQIAADAIPPPGPIHSEPDTTVQPDVALDPNDPTHLIAVFDESRFRGGASAGIGWAASHDGGRTWTNGNMPNLTQAVGGSWERASESSVAWGPGHVAFASALVVSYRAGQTGIAVQRSTDGGLTWSDPAIIQSDPISQEFNEKGWIAVDTFPSSPHYGRVYVAWDRAAPDGSEPLVLRYSDDQGQTWSGLISLAGSAGLGVRPLVEPNGHLVLVWDDFGSGKDEEVSAVSKDGGNTWSPETVIDAFEGTEPPDMRTGKLPSAAVDPINGALYVAWQDARFRSDGTNDVVLSSSGDEGARWRPIHVVNTDPPTDGVDHFTPAVAAYGRVVHVTYRTRIYNEGVWSRRVGMGYARSRDRGVTFGPEIQLGPPTNILYAARGYGKFLGDYMAIAAWAGVAHPVWCVARRIRPREKWHQTTWSSTIGG